MIGVELPTPQLDAVKASSVAKINRLAERNRISSQDWFRLIPSSFVAGWMDRAAFRSPIASPALSRDKCQLARISFWLRKQRDSSRHPLIDIRPKVA